MKTKRSATQSQQNISKPRKQTNDTASTNQRKRLIDARRKRPLSTIQIRHELDVFQPAARIFELRHDQGYNIITQWDKQETPEGYMHRVAKYVLLAGKYKGDFANG